MKKRLAKAFGLLATIGSLANHSQAQDGHARPVDKLDAYNAALNEYCETNNGTTSLRAMINLAYGTRAGEVLTKAMEYQKNDKRCPNLASKEPTPEVLDRVINIFAEKPGHAGHSDINGVSINKEALGKHKGTALRHEVEHAEQEDALNSSSSQFGKSIILQIYDLAPRFGDNFTPNVKLKNGEFIVKGKADAIMYQPTNSPIISIGGGAGFLSYMISPNETEARLANFKSYYYQATGIIIDSPEAAAQALQAAGVKLDEKILKEFNLPSSPYRLTPEQLKAAKKIPGKSLDTRDLLNAFNGCRNYTDTRFKIQKEESRGMSSFSIIDSKKNPEFHRFLIQQMIFRLPAVTSNDTKIDYRALNFDRPAKGFIQPPDLGSMS